MSLDCATLGHVLAAERRQLVIQILDEHGELSQSALADRLFEVRGNPNPADNSIARKRELLALSQTHLPKLDTLKIIEIDDCKRVSPGPKFDTAVDALDALQKQIDENAQVVTDGGADE